MKKILFATSAMVATGLFAGTAQAADPIKLSVGGSMAHWFAHTSQDDKIKKSQTNGDAGGGIESKQSSKVQFNGSTTLDNGIKVSTRLELKGDDADGKNTGKAFVKLSGDFGQVTLGSDGTAGNSMHVSPPSSGFIGYDDGSFGGFMHKPKQNEGSGPDTYMALAGGNDRKITYMSPSFSGLKFGASFTPESGIESDKNVKSDQNARAHNGVSIATAYSGDFSGVSLSASLGYERIELANSKVKKGEDDAAQSWGAGVSLGFDAFTLGFAYGTGTGKDDTEVESTSYSVGVGYTMGDASVSVGYASGTVEDNSKDHKNTDEKSTDVFDVGLAYKVSPGIDWKSSVTFVSFDGDKKDSAGNTYSGNKTETGEGLIIGTGIALSF